MASRYDIILEKQIPEIVYQFPEDWNKKGWKVFKNSPDGYRYRDEDHKCYLYKTYVGLKGQGFICNCGNCWSYMSGKKLDEWHEIVEKLKLKRDTRLTKGFTEE